MVDMVSLYTNLWKGNSEEDKKIRQRSYSKRVWLQPERCHGRNMLQLTKLQVWIHCFTLLVNTCYSPAIYVNFLWLIHRGQGGYYIEEFTPVSVSGGSRDTVNPFSVDNRSPYSNVVTRAPYVPIDTRNVRYTGEDLLSNIGDPMDDACGTTEWRPWSICSDPCGSGVRYQLRTFLRPSQAKRQKCETHVKLKNMEQCPRTPECRDTVQKV